MAKDKKEKKAKKGKKSPKLCPECGSELPKRAKTCPSCGAELKKKGKLRILLLIVAVVVVLAAAAAAFLLFRGRANQPKEPSLTEISTQAPAAIFENPEDSTNLVGQNLYIDGEAGTILRLSGQDCCEITTEDGSFALLSRTYTPVEEWEKLAEGVKLRAYFRYLGPSEIFEMPSGALLLIEVAEEEEESEEESDEEADDGSEEESDG